VQQLAQQWEAGAEKVPQLAGGVRRSSARVGAAALRCTLHSLLGGVRAGRAAGWKASVCVGTGERYLEGAHAAEVQMEAVLSHLEAGLGLKLKVEAVLSHLERQRARGRGDGGVNGAN
jgi:hypothetical protein